MHYLCRWQYDDAAAAVAVYNEADTMRRLRPLIERQREAQIDRLPVPDDDSITRFF